MAGELIPQIVIRAAERRGSVDEIVTRWIADAYQPQPMDIRKLWADHFASVADYWRHKQGTRTAMRAGWLSSMSGRIA